MWKRKQPRSSRQGETGSVSIQLVILLPALFTVMFLGMQAALLFHARTVAIAAAQEGARAVATEGGYESRGIAAAQGFVNDVGGPDVLAGASVTVDRSPTSATVTVEGRSLSVIPGWAPVVRQSASLPVERLTAP